jgi:CRISPR-associated endoribonuclease Cas6
MPSRWEVLLAGPQGAPVPLAAPQAVVSGWLDDPPQRGSDPAQGPAVRSAHADPARAWACGPLQTSPRAGPDEAAAVTILHVRLLDDALAGRLISAVRPGRPVRLGACEYQITAPPRQIGLAAWAVLRAWTGERAWQVRFVTPVCLRRGNRTSPWPAPDSVARGLAERWRRLDPATAPPLPPRGGAPVWVSDIEGHSEAHTLTRRARRGGQRLLTDEVISGFTGRIRYVCDSGTETEAADFAALMAFAAYAGAGSHTTYGFGVVCPEPTWQPPTLRPGQP